MKFVELQRALDVAMSEALFDEGFWRTADGNWKRKRGVELNIISFQKHSVHASFCVNLGIHYSFVPKAGRTDALEGDEIKQSECVIKLRLSPNSLLKDKWWPIDASSVNEVVDLLFSRGMSIFDSYRLNGQIQLIQTIDIEASTANLLSSLTKVGACLLLAQIHEQSGNRDKCIEAATTGLRLAGMAVGPRKALTEILRRLGHQE